VAQTFILNDHRRVDPMNAHVSRPGRRKYKPGDRFESLVLVERLAGPGDARAVFRCDCGTLKELKLGNVTSGATTNCADRSQHRDPRLVDMPAYGTAHKRVTRAKGPARAYTCAATGCDRQANDWAYRHGAVAPLVQRHGTKDDGKPYADDPELYVPLCRAHHQAWDAAWLSQTGNPLGISLAHVTAFEATR
jgi:hypothetical protein